MNDTSQITETFSDHLLGASIPDRDARLRMVRLEQPLAEILESGIQILPQSLSEAVQYLREDTVIQNGLGCVADDFIDLKIREWETYDRQVTPWEVNEYLTFF